MKFWKSFGLGVSSLWLLAITVQPALASEIVAVRYGILERSLPVADLRVYVEAGKISTRLQAYLNLLGKDEQLELQEFLKTILTLDLVTVAEVMDRSPGSEFLAQLATTTVRTDNAGVQALKAAIITGIQSSKGLSILSFLEAYPSKKLTLDFSQASQVLAASSPKPPTDILNTLAYWRTTVDYQATFTQGKHYKICLFGDSISSPLGNSLGEQTFNFSLGGMSTISLLAQLQYLSSTDLKCQTAILEIGTNDSWYTIEDIEFSQKLSQVIELLRSHGTQQIVLLPAFYSTLAASQNRNLAGSIERVEHINRLLSQVASIKGVPIANTELQPLFEGKVLKQNLTLDGVHLNAEGLEIYRASLLKIIGSLQKHKT